MHAFLPFPFLNVAHIRFFSNDSAVIFVNISLENVRAAGICGSGKINLCLFTHNVGEKECVFRVYVIHFLIEHIDKR